MAGGPGDGDHPLAVLDGALVALQHGFRPPDPKSDVQPPGELVVGEVVHRRARPVHGVVGRQAHEVRGEGDLAGGGHRQGACSQPVARWEARCPPHHVLVAVLERSAGGQLRDQLCAFERGVVGEGVEGGHESVVSGPVAAQEVLDAGAEGDDGHPGRMAARESLQQLDEGASTFLELPGDAQGRGQGDQQLDPHRLALGTPARRRNGAPYQRAARAGALGALR